MFDSIAYAIVISRTIEAVVVLIMVAILCYIVTKLLKHTE